MDLSRLFENSNATIDVPAGEIIFEQGSNGDQMYVLLEGELDVHVDGQAVDAFHPGEMIGEMALVDDTVRSATLVSKTDSRLAVVDKRRFLFLVQETPFFALHVMHIMADRLRRLHSKAD